MFESERGLIECRRLGTLQTSRDSLSGDLNL